MKRMLPIIVCLLTACVSAPKPVSVRNSELTQGNVQMNLAVGQTTKADVLETFGAPNVTTRDSSGLEVWSYQRQAQVSQASQRSGLWTIWLAGASSQASGFETTSRMLTLIIKFDAADTVTAFSSRSSEF